MKLTNIAYDLIWPIDVEVNNLRKYIINDLSQKGDIVRWSINNIKVSSKPEKRILTLNALIIN